MENEFKINKLHTEEDAENVIEELQKIAHVEQVRVDESAGTVIIDSAIDIPAVNIEEALKGTPYTVELED